MKIIRPGREPEPVAYRAECQRCGAELEYADADVRRSSDFASDGQKSVESIRCPCCATTIVVNGRRKKGDDV